MPTSSAQWWSATCDECGAEPELESGGVRLFPSEGDLVDDLADEDWKIGAVDGSLILCCPNCRIDDEDTDGEDDE